MEYLNKVGQDSFTYSALPTSDSPEPKQTSLLKSIKFKDLVDQFGDIIFNFEYRRMVTDFFHPVGRTTPEEASEE